MQIPIGFYSVEAEHAGNVITGHHLSLGSRGPAFHPVGRQNVHLRPHHLMINGLQPGFLLFLGRQTSPYGKT